MTTRATDQDTPSPSIVTTLALTAILNTITRTGTSPKAFFAVRNEKTGQSVRYRLAKDRGRRPSRYSPNGREPWPHAWRVESYGEVDNKDRRFLAILWDNANPKSRYQTDDPSRRWSFKHNSRYSDVPASHRSVKGFEFIVQLLNSPNQPWPPSLRIEHAGSCFCCGRRLDDEESKRLGVGPVCRKKHPDVVAALNGEAIIEKAYQAQQDRASDRARSMTAAPVVEPASPAPVSILSPTWSATAEGPRPAERDRGRSYERRERVRAEMAQPVRPNPVNLRAITPMGDRVASPTVEAWNLLGDEETLEAVRNAGRALFGGEYVDILVDERRGLRADLEFE